MKTNVFVKTKNVKGFVALMSELENLPLKIPKIALVTGDFGLGKSETIKWWSFKNDCIYVRANQGMSSRWLLSEIADELGEEYYWNIDYMIKCFCADVEAKKVMSVFNFGKHVVNMFYQSFRQALYQKQKDELLRWLKVKPKIPQEREYMGTTVYLYLYNNKLYVLEKPIRTKEPKKHTEEERLLIKNIYLRSYRKVLSRSFAFKFHLHLCEEIWKYGKDYDEQYTAINNILFA